MLHQNDPERIPGPELGGRHASDLAWVRAVCAADFAAFRELHELYLARVAVLVRRRGHGGREAEELTALVLRTVFAHLDAYRGRTSLAAWVLAIARKVCDLHARNRRGDAAAPGA